MSFEHEPAQFDPMDPEIREMLKKRYGVVERNSRWRWAAMIVAAIGIPWLVWSAWHHSNPEIRTNLVSFQVIDSRTIEITFDLFRRDPGTPLICTVVARDFDKNVAGELDIQVPPSKEPSLRLSAKIPTRVNPVNAALLRCSINDN